MFLICRLNDSESPLPFARNQTHVDENKSKRKKTEDDPLIRDSGGNVVAVIDRKQNDDIRLLGDTELAVFDYIGNHVDDRIESIDFKGKRVTFDEIIEADNSVKFNMTGHFGQLLAKLGIHHLKPKYEDDEIITYNKGDSEMHQLWWYSTVEIPGFDAHGPVHPSPEDPCKSLITRDRVKDIVKDRPLRGVYFDNKRDAHNAALREAHRLFMDYVRSKSVAMHE